MSGKRTSHIRVDGIQFRVPPDVCETLNRMSRDRMKNYTEIIKELLNIYLKKNGLIYNNSISLSNNIRRLQHSLGLTSREFFIEIMTQDEAFIEKKIQSKDKPDLHILIQIKIDK